MAFVLEMQSRPIQVVGCTPYPNEAFVIQCLRQAADDGGLLSDGRLIAIRSGAAPLNSGYARPGCKLSGRRPARRTVMPTRSGSFGRLRKNASTASFRSANGTCAALQDFTAHYHRGRNHQGLANELIERPPAQRVTGAVRCRQRVGGILNFYHRSAA